jgi:Ca2+-binding EF-hand superfamily protein
VYRQLLTFPSKRLRCPGFDLPDERRRRDFLAKSFFREADADRSGSLARHELDGALDDGFAPEERATVFARVDADGTGAVSLGEFVRG